MSKQEELLRAVKTAVNILSYADNPPRKLYEKLTRKGYASDVAEAAVAFVIGKGILNEEGQLEAAIRYLTSIKLFGRRRVYSELNRRGFTHSVVENSAQIYLDEIDFDENCAKLLRKQGSLDSKEARDRAARALLRYGYDSAQIRRALDSVCDE